MLRRFPLLLLLPLMAITAAPAGGPAGEASEALPPVDVNAADADALAELPGVTAELARAIVAWREAHGPFADREAVREVPGVTPLIWVGIADRLRALPPLRDPAEDAPVAGITALSNYFVTFDGVDLSALAPERREKFLQTVNHESCPCGCTGDSIARCYVNDPSCGVARSRLRALYEEVRTAPGAAEQDAAPR